MDILALVSMRIEALKLALQSGVDVSDGAAVIKTAQVFFEFIKGESK